MTTATPIDRHDNTIVTSDARSSAGRYRFIASHLLTVTRLDVSRPPGAVNGCTGLP